MTEENFSLFAPAEPPPPPRPMSPVETSERIDTIDILRGLALFGILAANIRGFAGPASVYFEPERFWPSLPDRIGQAVVDILIQGKFITIFAFLFGVGFTVQLARAEARSVRFGRFFSRRLFVLALFGLVHGLLIWFGDILLVYALTGFMLLLFRKRKDRTLVMWGVILYLVPFLIIASAYVAIATMGEAPPGPPRLTEQELQQQVAVFAGGSWSAIEEQRVADVVSLNWGFMPFFMWQVFGLFLFGVLAHRKGFFTPAPESLPRYRTAMLWALPIGLAGNIAAVAVRWFADQPPFPPTKEMVLMMAFQTVGIPALSLGYSCAVILLCADPAWKERLSRFGAVGRMALSNYLLQSVAGTLLFYSYGLGLFGTMGPAILWIPTFVLYGLQTVVSPWWLARFRFGPAEWLWRTMTYGKAQAFRISVPSA